MDIRHLRYFVRIADLKSMARAATELHVAQSALGLHIRNLERELKVQLLVRHSRGVELTEAGRVLREHAVKLVLGVEEAREAVQATSIIVDQRIVLGVTPPMQRPLMIAMAKLKKAEHLRFTVRVVDGHSEALVEQVSANKMSMCCAYNVGEHEGYQRMKILDDDIVFVEQRAGHVVSPTIDFAEFARRPLALPPLPHPARILLEGAAKRRGLSLNIAFESLSVLAIRELVQHGLAAAAFPFGTVACDVEDKRIEIRRIVSPGLTMPLWFFHSTQHALSRAETALETTLRKALVDEISNAKERWMQGYRTGRAPSRIPPGNLTMAPARKRRKTVRAAAV